MDVLSNVLNVAQLNEAVISQQNFEPPWSMEIGGKVHAAVHIVKRGMCWFWVEGWSKPVRLHSGDIVFIPGGATHFISDAPETPPRPFELVVAEQIARQKLTDSKPDTTATLVCVQLMFDHQEAHPLLSVLPDAIHIASEADHADDDLRTVARLLIKEFSQADIGSKLIVPRMTDTLVVLLVRRWLVSHPFENAGWLGALRDPQIARSLGLMHETPENRWTIETLANQVAMSRAAFARRFCSLVGEPPLSYLTRWRMSLAAKLLKTSEDSLDRIAGKVGYESSTAFANAFRRQYSVAPGHYRIAYRNDRKTQKR